jgi:hypothetical protein
VLALDRFVLDFFRAKGAFFHDRLVASLVRFLAMSSRTLPAHLTSGPKKTPAVARIKDFCF